MSFVRPPLLATIFTFLGVVILCTLGYWQVQRLAWKTALLANMRAQIDAPVQNLTAADIPGTPQSTFFKRGRMTGRFDYAREILIGPKSYDGAFVYDVVTPLIMEGDQSILVRRGYIYDYARANYKNKGRMEDVRVTGYLRPPLRHGWVHKISGIENDPQQDVWRYINLDQIAKESALDRLMPVVMNAQSMSGSTGGVHMFDQEIALPNNNHRQYVFFWFTMAGALLSVFTLRFCIKKAS